MLDYSVQFGWVRRVLTALISRTNIVSLCLELNLSYIAARITLAISKFYNKGSDVSVLCLGRPIFDDDIKAMSDFSGKINYIIVPKTVFMSIFDVYLGSMGKNRHVDYYSEELFNQNKAEYRVQVGKLFDSLLSMLKFDAVMSGNYVYAWQQEVSNYCIESKIKFIVLNKEGLSPKGTYFNHVKRYTNGNFVGDLMLVCNKNIGNALLLSDIKGLTSNKLSVVGVPRLDKYYYVSTTGGSSVVFFSFSIHDKIDHLGFDVNTYQDYIEKAKKFHREVIKFAVQNPSITVTIKTKAANRYVSYVYNIMNSFEVNNIDNVVVTNTVASDELIMKSQAVIAFNSTTLFEALIANRKVISPRFDGPLKGYFDDNEYLINYANDSGSISEIINSSNTVTCDNNDSNRLLEEYVGIADGNASLRAENAIIECLHSN